MRLAGGEQSKEAGTPSRGNLAAIFWPAPSSGDSELLRRKKFVVRGGHLATALLVAVAVAGTAVARFPYLSVSRLIGLGATGVAYILWSLYGTREAVRFVLWNRDGRPPPAWPLRGRTQSIGHVAVQFAAAELMILLAGPSESPPMLWLVLLPPIAYAVMFHRPSAIAVTSILTVAIHTFNVVHWHGWGPVPGRLPAFVLAVLFTLVFTQIAVSAERARVEIERLAHELHEANGKLRRSALQAEELSATRERNRVAREIHDSVGHCLTVVHVQLQAARAMLDEDRALAVAALDKAQSMTQSGLQEIRRSVSALRSSPLDGRPITEALRELVAESCVGGLVAELTVVGAARPVSPQLELTFYRAGQEGLTNSRKHAHAGMVRLVLDFGRADTIQLTVSDNGAGVERVAEGFGLLGLRERANLLGGEARVRSSPGNGFTLEVEAPG